MNDTIKLMTGTAGVVTSELARQATEVLTATDVTGVVMQVLIGIVTLWGLLRKKKNKNEPNNM